MTRTQNHARRRAKLRPTALATALATALTLMAGSASATDWINAGIGDWFDAGNWSGGIVPSGAFAIANIQDGGFAFLDSPGASTSFLSLGYPGSAEKGFLNVNGAGTLTVFSSLSVGNGTLTVYGGGKVNVPINPSPCPTCASGQVFVGLDSFGNGGGGGVAATLLVKDAGSSLTTVDLGVGNGGTLGIQNGGNVTTSNLNTGGNAQVGVTGASSLLSVGTVVMSGASLSVADHGTVNVAGYLEAFAGANSINVSGSGSALYVTGASGLILGEGGSSFASATLSVQAGGTVVSSTAQLLGNGFIASVPNASATVSGANALWINTGLLKIGGSTGSPSAPAGTGALTISNGGALVNGGAILGDLAGSYGTATVDGAGSRWNNSGDIVAGNLGVAIVNVTNGAHLTSQRGLVGNGAGSNGAVFISGAGSSWQTSGPLYVGNAGLGQVNVSSGAVVNTAGSSYLGFAAGSQGTASVAGAGAVWNTVAPGTSLNIGGSDTAAGGSAQLSVGAGGTVNTLATNLYSTGFLGLSDNAQFTGHITSTGGTIGTQGVTTLGSAMTLGAGGVSVRTGNSAATISTFSGNIDGSGGLHKSSFLGNGAGTLVLTGNNTYTGATVVDIGTLVVNGTNTSAVTVNAGKLGGTGSIFAAVQVGNGTGTADAILAPGQGVGTLSTGDLSFQSDGVYAFEIDSAAGVADKIAVTGSVAIAAGATFSFSDLSAGLLKPGTSFVAIDNDGADAINGQFANLAQGGVFSLGGNTYEANYFGGTGNDLVLSSAVPEPASWAMLLAGGLGLAIKRRPGLERRSMAASRVT